MGEDLLNRRNEEKTEKIRVYPKIEKRIGLLEIIFFGLLALLDIVGLYSIPLKIYYIVFLVVLLLALLLSNRNRKEITFPYFLRYHNIATGIFFTIGLYRGQMENIQLPMGNLFYITTIVGIFALPVLGKPAYEYIKNTKEK